jgi:hypothetical protein
MYDNTVLQKNDAEYIKEGMTTYEVVRKYTGTAAVLDLIKAAVKREAETLLQDMENS